MIRFAKGEARVLIDDESRAPTGDIDFRVRCVVHTQKYDRLFYGLTANDLNLSPPDGDVIDTFDHSEWRGRRSRGQWAEEKLATHFFTQGLGRLDEIKKRRASEGSIRK